MWARCGGWSPRCSRAASTARPPTSTRLVARGANVNGRSGAQLQTPLIVACERVSSDALDAGAQSLAYAARARDHAVVTALIDAGAKVNVTDSDGLSSLDVACRVGAADVVPLLLSAGAADVTVDRGRIHAAMSCVRGTKTPQSCRCCSRPAPM